MWEVILDLSSCPCRNKKCGKRTTKVIIKESNHHRAKKITLNNEFIATTLLGNGDT